MQSMHKNNGGLIHNKNKKHMLMTKDVSSIGDYYMPCYS